MLYSNHSAYSKFAILAQNQFFVMTRNRNPNFSVIIKLKRIYIPHYISAFSNDCQNKYALYFLHIT